MTIIKGDILLNNNTLRYDIIAADWLTDFCFDWRLLGTLYICDAISLILREGEAVLHQSFTKEILPGIARRRGTNWRSVERAMRYAIEGAWMRAFPEVLYMYFPQEFPQTGRPSVSLFVTTIGREALRDFEQKVSQ